MKESRRTRWSGARGISPSGASGGTIAGNDQPILRAGHRDVIEAQPLLALFRLPRLPNRLVLERTATFARDRIRHPEAEAAVRQRQDLVGRRRRLVAPGVGDDDDLELEPLRAMNRQEPDRIRPLLFRRRLELARTDGLLIADETHETFDVGPAQLLVRPRESRQLAQVRVPPAAVPPCEDGKVVVVLRHDSLAEPLERRARRDRR